ncbi:MAG: Uncharacterised protein [Halieaceae bacterium]|nr:MAG: Uncharacterised protein [Halieaceae bacterium]
MLKSILMVWVLAHNLALTQEAYEDYLGYRSVDAGVMSAELAAAIDRPELADRRFVTMMPRSGPQVGLRLVEGDTSGYVPMKRVGWSAIELLVQDPEQLESELPGSAFRHLQGPDFLTEQKNILAMQVTGPNQELFYLTHMIDPSKSFLQPQPSPEPVGQTFIMVMGSPDLEASLAFWRRYFDNGIVGPIPYRIGVLSDAYDLPGETLHPLALVSMSDGYGIEIDQYPDEATAVPAPEDERGGVILVSLSVDPEGLKAPLPWRLPYTNAAGAVEGGVMILPSGAPIEIALTNAMLPAPAP